MGVFHILIISMGYVLASAITLAEVKTVNTSFEQGLDGWLLYLEESIAADSKIILQDKIPKFTDGNKHVLMALSGRATDNQSQYITLGQSLNLNSKKRYRYSVKVKWNNPNNSLPSAIVSTWIKNEDGSYSGSDQWLRNTESKILEFEFSPTADSPVFCYISLLTHQEGFDKTEILVDSFVVQEVGENLRTLDPRPANQNLLLNSSFDDGLNSWSLTNNNPHSVDGLTCSIQSEEKSSRLMLELPEADSKTYLNNTWTGVFQTIKLYAGNTYRVSAVIERLVPKGTEYDTIVNVYALKSTSPKSWLGSVDYKFNKNGLHGYSELITPTETAVYEITTRVFGWANEGRPLSVGIDNFEIKREP